MKLYNTNETAELSGLYGNILLLSDEELDLLREPLRCYRSKIAERAVVSLFCRDTLGEITRVRP